MLNDAPQSLEEILFDLAVQKPTVAERVAFLNHACRANPDLRAALDELLEAHFGAAGFLPEPDSARIPPLAALAPVGPPPPIEIPAPMIGRYKLLEQIGEGGFGEVWMAEQREPVKRRVALKIIKLGMDSRQIVARFEAERQALALMEHPNIAKIFDAGTIQTQSAEGIMLNPSADSALLTPPSAFLPGRPYFVMELVRGVKITEYCDEHQLPTRERLKLFILVCHAIQHAHQKGIIHRDIKPSNILVTVNDGVAVPKIIDFGIAKAAQGELTDKTVFTQFQQFIGTPAYISPEQAGMSSLDIDTRADIYSLGVLLYELLTGSTPFDAQELLKAGFDEMRRVIREREPEKPSTRLTQRLRRGPHSSRVTRHSTLATDLDWIVLKCLEKDRTRRYETANGLATDIQRHLTNEPVTARPPSTAYKIQKAWQRNKLAFSAAAAVVLALVMGISVSTWQMIRATQAEREQSRLRERAENEQRQAQDARAGEAKHRQSAERARENETLLRQRAQAQESEARRIAYNSDMNLAQQALQQNNLGRASLILNRHRPKPGESDLRGWEWRYLWRLCRSDASLTLCRKSNRIYSVSFSHGGQFLAVQDSSSEVSVWDLASRRTIMSRLTGVSKQRIAFSPVTNHLAFSEKASGDQWKVILWDLEKEEAIRQWSISEPGRELVFSRDGKSLCALTDNEGAAQIVLWDINSGRLQLEAQTARDSRGEGNVLALSEQAQTVAVGNRAGGVSLIDVAAGVGQRNLQVTGERTMSLALMNGGTILASGGGFTDSVVRLWDVARGEEVGQLKGHRSYVHAMATSPDGRFLATASGDQTIRIWDWKQRQSVRTLRGHSSQVFDVAFSPDGHTVASGSRDGTVNLWSVSRSSYEGEFDLLPNVPSDWTFSPDGQLIVAVANGTVRCWTTTNLQESRRFGTLETNMTSIAFSGDGALLAVASESGQVLLINPLTGAETRSFNTGSAPVWVLGFGAEDHSVLLLDGKAVLSEWDLRSRQRTHQWTFPERPGQVALARTEASLVTRNWGGVAVWRTTDGQKLWNTPLEGGNPAGLAPDGRVVAVPSGDGFTKLFDARTGAETGRLAGSLLGNHSVGFSPDGQRLAIGSDGSEAVKVWDMGLRQELLTLEGQGSGFHRTAFSSDGRFLGSSGMKGLHLWRAPTWEEIASAERESNAESQRP